MNNTPSLLLLLFLLTPGPGGSPNPAMALHCPANITISDTNHVANIISVPGDSSSNLYTITRLYVHPEQGFKGVSLLVDVQNTGCGFSSELHEVWFPLEEKCFQGNSEWWLVLAWVMGKRYMFDQYNKLVFRVLTGKCFCECYKNGPAISVWSLSVTGHGTSGWKLKRPESRCSTAGILHLRSTHECSVSVCSEPPDTATPDSRDAGPPDTATPDSRDAGPPDTVTPDSRDAGPPDTVTPNSRDAGPPDTATPDSRDAGPPDTATPDSRGAGPPDTATPDSRGAGPPDTATPDSRGAGPPDAATPDSRDAGPPDTATPDSRDAGPPDTAMSYYTGSGYSRVHILDWYCPANITIWEADHKANIITERGKAAEKILRTLVLLHPEPGLKGVSLVVVVAPGGGDGDGGERHDVWFALEDKCFQGNVDWWVVWASALIYEDNHRLYFRVKVGDCSYNCYKTGTFSRIMILRLTAHGTSGWRFSYPRDIRCTQRFTWLDSFGTSIREHQLCKASPPERTSPPGPHYTIPAPSATPIAHITLTTSTRATERTTSPVSAIVGTVVVVVAWVLLKAMRLCRSDEEKTEETEMAELRPQNTESSAEMRPQNMESSTEMPPQNAESSDEEAITVVSSTYV